MMRYTKLPAYLLVGCLLHHMTIAFIPTTLPIPPNGVTKTTAPTWIVHSIRTTRLFGSFNKKKIEELKSKERQRKKQRKQADGSLTTEDGMYLLNDEEDLQEERDRKAFGEFLSQDGNKKYLNNTKDKFTGYTKFEGEHAPVRYTLFEGDHAPVQPFYHLVSVHTGVALNETTTGNILPWDNRNVLAQEEYMDYTVIVSDPRAKSSEFRTTMKLFATGLPHEIQQRIIFINADTHAENKRWLKKNNVHIELFSDEHKEWMKKYNTLGKQRWSMSMVILANGRVQRMVRELDFDSALRIVTNSVKTLEIVQF